MLRFRVDVVCDLKAPLGKICSCHCEKPGCDRRDQYKSGDVVVPSMSLEQRCIYKIYNESKAYNRLHAGTYIF